MKKASRFMPKYMDKKVNPLGLAICITILVLFIVYNIEVLYVIIGITIFITIVTLNDIPKVKAHFSSMYESRKSLSICDFSKEFNCKEVDTWVIRAVYEQLQDYISFEKLIPIKGTDDLKNDLLLDEDDIDMDLVEQISQRTGRTLDNYESNPLYGKVFTAKDLVLFFNYQPKVNSN